MKGKHYVWKYFFSGFGNLKANSVSYNQLLTMSSESVVDVKKRSSDEVDPNKNSAKKLKDSCEPIISEVISSSIETSNRVRKPKKVVILLCYLGKTFFGMQRNQNVSTVEAALLKALLETNIILKNEYDFPKTMKFQRAARTDKGVSAARQIVSLKIPQKEIAETFPEKVNKCLPPEIRVLAVKRVTQSFDAKIACDARTYSYTLPTFAFEPNKNGNSEDYRIPDERIQEVHAFLQKYLGTHNYYNFTSGRSPGDPSCKRYIMAIQCGQPFELNGLEFCVIQIKGQSFMLHQIRKMVGLAIAFMRNLADLSVLEKSWSNERIDIPKAPGLGLLLEELHYDWYNSKYGSDGIHEALTWKECDEFVSKFKTERIWADIAQTEKEEKSMLQWLETLPYHSYDIRECGPNSRIFPEKADNGVDSKTLEAPEQQELQEVTSTLETSETSTVNNNVTENLCPNQNEKEIKNQS